MSARIELTAMFAPFLSGTTLEEAVSEAYAVVLNEGADALEARVADVDVPDTRTTWAGMDAAYLRHLATAPAAVPVPDETAGDKQPLRGRARLDANTVADAEATHWRRLGITPPQEPRRCTCGNAAYEQMYDRRVPCKPNCEMKQGGAS